MKIKKTEFKDLIKIEKLIKEQSIIVDECLDLIDIL